MRHRIARLAGLPLLPLLALLLPGSGRRRRRRPPATEPTASPYPPDVTVRRTGLPALRGEDNVLVRPYLLAHERQEEARRRHARRRALRFAVHGIDVGTRVPHDVEVAR
ncbi:hypothetical protein ACFQ9U_10100 [Streptomyces sp. NPDC056568]|uniref:hypothetical protein n=1 Tax=Streptomyces sp. NPDC056568 TaxID=3345866 RepID=UPI0036864E28